MRKYEITLVISAPEDEHPRGWDWEGLIGETVYSVNVKEEA